MQENNFFRSKHYSFTGKPTPGVSTSITVHYRPNGGAIGKLCGVTQRFFIFPACAVTIAVDELPELAEFTAELLTKFTPVGVLNELPPVQEITPVKTDQILPPVVQKKKFTRLKVAPVQKQTTGNSSKGVACSCTGTKADRRKNWLVLQYKCNYSAFSGGNLTPSEWSQVKCGCCGNVWRTKLPYIESLPRAHTKTA